VRAGDVLVGEDGERVEVEEVYDTGEYATVYNLRVAEYHTYFVGCEEWGFSVWAHNQNCTGEEIRGLLQKLQEEDPTVRIPSGRVLNNVAEQISGGRLGEARRTLQRNKVKGDVLSGDGVREAVINRFGTDADEVLSVFGRGSRADAAEVARLLNAGDVADVVAAQAVLQRMGVDPDLPTARQFMAQRSIYGTNQQRPRFSDKQYLEIWRNAKVQDRASPEFGQVWDNWHPAGRRQIVWTEGTPRQGIWDAGHISGQKYSDIHASYLRGEISIQELVSHTTNLNNYRPEVALGRGGNRSRRNQD
jgi:hypothetical protein